MGLAPVRKRCDRQLAALLRARQRHDYLPRGRAGAIRPVFMFNNNCLFFVGRVSSLVDAREPCVGSCVVAAASRHCHQLGQNVLPPMCSAPCSSTDIYHATPYHALNCGAASMHFATLPRIIARSHAHDLRPVRRLYWRHGLYARTLCESQGLPSAACSNVVYSVVCMLCVHSRERQNIQRESERERESVCVRVRAKERGCDAQTGEESGSAIPMFACMCVCLEAERCVGDKPTAGFLETNQQWCVAECCSPRPCRRCCPVSCNRLWPNGCSTVTPCPLKTGKCHSFICRISLV